MIFLVNRSLDTYFNMAAEEYFLDHAQEDVFLFWQNRNTIVVGKNQNTLSEIDADYVEAHGIQVVRRLTGGGAMYQDLGNLNFTYICKNTGGWFSDFSRFTDPVIRALRELGVPAELSGRNDITVDGRKISGNAQTVRSDKLLHHGTLLFDSNVDILSGALKPDREKVRSKGVASVASRVANINEFLDEKLNCERLIQEIKKSVAQAYPALRDVQLTPEDRAAIQRLADEKYRTWEWNYGYSPKYDFSKKSRFAGGSVEVCFQVADGVIQNARIFGDFFGVQDVSALESALCGVRHTPEALRQVLGKFDLSEYFLRIAPDEILQAMY